MRRNIGALREKLLRHRRITDRGCWEWTRSRNRGYGHIGLNGKVFRVPRVAYRIFVGPIRKGKKILHKCDNPPCFNPTHLYQGTQQENLDDARRRSRIPPRVRPTSCINGHKFTVANSVWLKRTNPKTGAVYDLRRCRICIAAIKAEGRKRCQVQVSKNRMSKR